MSAVPKRIQRKRTKGWRMPEGAVYVGRPSKWGNPFTANGDRDQATGLFREYVDRAPTGDGLWGRRDETAHETIRRELAGKNLACWCPLDQPCHADVLLEIANAAEGGDQP
ncbi:DUF4326 domain-containing protein [Rhodococcus hoagii]|nr:DUF4326 domain-containing protein [Prescottella equi]NKU90785.1 DUF4326 domain-containing protein [Prescottella equi]